MMVRKPHIVFVDDEPFVLGAIRRMLNGNRVKWDMSFADSGHAALELIGSLPADVVVADLRMPGMSGVELLEQVRLEHPDTIRLILSGEQSSAFPWIAASAIHRFLSKPCELGVLRDAITRALALRQLLPDASHQQLIRCIDALPALPNSYTQLLQELESNEPSLRSVQEIVSQDVGLSARMLQMANSALFSPNKPVTSIGQAVTMLGFNSVKKLLLSTAVYARFEYNPQLLSSIQNIEQHCFDVAAMARKIAIAEGASNADVEAAFAAGLLHDVGKLVEAVAYPAEYSVLFPEGAAVQPLVELEYSYLLTSHAEIGAYLLGLWGFSEAIVEAVVWHHRPALCRSTGFSSATALHIANGLVYRSTNPEKCMSNRLDLDYLASAGFLPKLISWKNLAGTYNLTGALSGPDINGRR